MRLSKFLLVVIIAMALGSIYQAQECCAQQYYQAGDINYDGWCNMAELNILVGWIAGTCDAAGLCMEGADCNGSGSVNGLDIACFIAFFNGGAAPIGLCPAVFKTCDPSEQAEIWIVPISNSDPDQATFSVYVEASAAIGALSFSYKYDPLEIASFDTENYANIWALEINDRAFVGGDNICAFLVQCANNGFGQDYPMGIGGTRIFDIVIDRQPGAPEALLRIVEDPYHGPPYFYFGMGNNCAGEDVICPFVPLTVTGDVNGSDSYNGLDITYGVNFLKGGPKPLAKYFYNVPVQWDY